MSRTEFDNEEDIAAIERYRSGQKEAANDIIERYKDLVLSQARSYYLLGAEQDDVIQEGMIGLFNAITRYNTQSGVPFVSFALLCIRTQIQTAVKLSQRFKHQFLNEYVSLDQAVSDEDGNETSLLNLIPDSAAVSPEEEMIAKENEELFSKLKNKYLSPLESKVLDLFLEGKNYREIAYEIGRNTKTVDNALIRIKGKISMINKR